MKGNVNYKENKFENRNHLVLDVYKYTFFQYKGIICDFLQKIRQIFLKHNPQSRILSNEILNQMIRIDVIKLRKIK